MFLPDARMAVPGLLFGRDVDNVGINKDIGLTDGLRFAFLFGNHGSIEFVSRKISPSVGVGYSCDYAEFSSGSIDVPLINQLLGDEITILASVDFTNSAAAYEAIFCQENAYIWCGRDGVTNDSWHWRVMRGTALIAPMIAPATDGPKIAGFRNVPGEMAIFENGKKIATSSNSYDVTVSGAAAAGAHATGTKDFLSGRLRFLYGFERGLLDAEIFKILTEPTVILTAAS